VLLMNTNAYDAALEKFNAVLGIDPSHSHSLYYVGIVSHQRRSRQGPADI